MSKMVERVGKAIADEYIAIHREFGAVYVHGEAAKERFGRAAIEAMREPGAPELRAASFAMFKWMMHDPVKQTDAEFDAQVTEGDLAEDRATFKMGLRAMIDEALK